MSIAKGLSFSHALCLFSTKKITSLLNVSSPGHRIVCYGPSESVRS